MFMKNLMLSLRVFIFLFFGIWIAFFMTLWTWGKMFIDMKLYEKDSIIS